MDGARKPLWTSVACPLEVVAVDSADTMAVASEWVLLLVLAAGLLWKFGMAY